MRKGIRGADTWPTSWSTWSAQPTALAAGAATPPFGRGPYCGWNRPTRLSPVVPLPPLPSLRSGAHNADACGVLPRRRSRRLPHVLIKRKSGARLRRATYLWTWKAARTPAWAIAHATGAPIRYAGKVKSRGSIPTPRMARAPARAGARATGLRSGTPGE